MKRARGGGLAALVALAAVAAAAAVASPARAEDDEELIRQGIEQRRVGQDLRALELFRRAVAIKRTPRGIGQIALAEQALGLWVKAEQDMKAALAQPNDPWIKSHRKTLDSALAIIEEHLGTLEIWGEPANAEVRAEDQVLGRLPDTGGLRVPVGPLNVSVRAPGYVSWSRPFDIKRSEFVKEHVRLTPSPAAAATPVTTTAPRAALALDAPRPAEPLPGPTVDQRAPSGSDTGDRPVYTRWWFWTVVGAVALGGAATAYALTRNSGTSCDPPGCWQ